MTSGCPAIGWTNGTGLYGPKRRLNATCCSGVSDCSAEEDHLVVEQRAADLGDDVVVELPARSTPPTTAPHGARVTGRR